MRAAAHAGISPRDFWRCTPREIVNAAEGHGRNAREQYRAASLHAAWIINTIRSAVGAKGPPTQPSDLLDIDGEKRRPRTLAPDSMTRAQAMERLIEEEHAEEFYGSRDGIKPSLFYAPDADADG